MVLLFLLLLLLLLFLLLPLLLLGTGGFYAAAAALTLVQFLWHFPPLPPLVHPGSRTNGTAAEASSGRRHGHCW